MPGDVCATCHLDWQAEDLQAEQDNPVLLFGAVDNSRLGNAERDHQPWVKQATKRTRRHMSTMMTEMDGVTRRMVAVQQMKAHERECAMGMRQ